jgi:hypothetical protein
LKFTGTSFTAASAAAAFVAADVSSEHTFKAIHLYNDWLQRGAIVFGQLSTNNLATVASGVGRPLLGLGPMLFVAQLTFLLVFG